MHPGRVDGLDYLQLVGQQVRHSEDAAVRRRAVRRGDEQRLVLAVELAMTPAGEWLGLHRSLQALLDESFADCGRRPGVESLGDAVARLAIGVGIHFER
jgi:hypothetical protein